MPSLRKIPTRLRGTNFCTSSARFAPSFISQTNGPKCTKIVRNAPNMRLGSNWVERVHSLRKIPMPLRGTNFCTGSAHFASSFVTQPNGPQCTKIVRNALKHDRVQWGDRVRSLRKFLKRLLGTNFCTSSARFAPSFVTQPNGHKCTKT